MSAHWGRNCRQTEYNGVLDFLGAREDGRANFLVENTAKTLCWPWLAQSQLIIWQLKRKVQINMSPNLLGWACAANVVSAERPELEDSWAGIYGAG